ncbi:hypothetical protein KSF_112180 [Reticulibacter mediterranei]|uniref:Uncharacterized protein n=1 Tax=Reticulibacter mediterranei TaxID=2778369 RepID=A0A8J3NA11_9CHLR|nr:hypothetical protein KSF_112180 [Reticulibacter mediterranei]
MLTMKDCFKHLLDVTRCDPTCSWEHVIQASNIYAWKRGKTIFRLAYDENTGWTSKCLRLPDDCREELVTDWLDNEQHISLTR